MKKLIFSLLFVLIGLATFAQLGGYLTVKKANSLYPQIDQGFQLKDTFYTETESRALFYTKKQSEALKNNNNFLESLQRLGTTIKAVPIGVGINSLMNGTSALVDGTVYYIAFDVADTIVSTGVNFVLSVAGSYTADNYNGFGLFSISGGTYTKITETATDGNLWKTTAFTLGAKAWPTPQTLLPGVYMIALQWNASATTTAPTIYTWGTLTANHALVLTNNNKISSYQTSQTALPASTIASTSLTVNSVLHGIWPY